MADVENLMHGRVLSVRKAYLSGGYGALNSPKVGIGSPQWLGASTAIIPETVFSLDDVLSAISASFTHDEFFEAMARVTKTVIRVERETVVTTVEEVGVFRG